MNEVRIIKKYPNRRLYDSAESRYITLNDIRQLVLDGHPFEVVDKKTGANITRGILLQVISEQELNGCSVLSEDFLVQIIRCSRGAPAELVRNFLEDSLGLFLEQQRRAATFLPDTPGDDGFEAVGELAHHNMERWLELQTASLRTFQSGSHTERDQSSGKLSER